MPTLYDPETHSATRLPYPFPGQAYPQRFARLRGSIIQTLKRHWPIAQRAAGSGELEFASFWQQAAMQSPPVLAALIDTARMGAGNAYDAAVEQAAHLLMLPARHALAGSRYFQTRDNLNDKLLATDIDLDVPARFLRLPYPSIYLRFGDTRALPVVVPGFRDGILRAEGVYLTETSFTVPPEVSQRENWPTGSRIRHLDVALCGYPAPEAPEASVGAIQIFTLAIPDDNASVHSVLEATLKRIATVQGGAGVLPEDIAAWESILAHTLKVLLYLNCDGALLEPDAEYAHARARVLALPPGKRVKAMREFERNGPVERIVVGPRWRDGDATEPHTAVHAGDAGEGDASVMPHTRRGHYRLQRYGPELSLSKLVWIQPVLVNAHLIAGAVSAPRYDLRG